MRDGMQQCQGDAGSGKFPFSAHANAGIPVQSQAGTAVGRWLKVQGPTTLQIVHCQGGRPYREGA